MASRGSSRVRSTGKAAGRPSSRRPRAVKGGTLEATLREAGIDASLPNFLVMVRDAVSSVRRVPAPDPVGQLPESEAQTLKRGGFDMGHPREGEATPLSQTVAAYIAMMNDALTVAEAARRLRLDQSRIRQLLSAGSLYGIKLRGEWRLPAFQFTKRGVVPGIQEVLRVVPEDLHPVEVWEWFRNPDPDLEIGEQIVSPLNWLSSGGEPQRASAVARDL